MEIRITERRGKATTCKYFCIERISYHDFTSDISSEYQVEQRFVSTQMLWGLVWKSGLPPITGGSEDNSRMPGKSIPVLSHRFCASGSAPSAILEKCPDPTGVVSKDTVGGPNGL